MAIQFLQDTLINGHFSFQESAFTSVVASGNTHTVDLTADTNNYKVIANNATNTLAFSNLSDKVIGKTGSIAIQNPASVGSLGWAALPATAYTPGGVAISFDTSSNGIAVISYLVMSANKVLINYVGDFGSYPQ
tara:strand:+ start:2512 stop:2913 length:402 start_codon:yes stop_codon:yes gene_type:complete